MTWQKMLGKDFFYHFNRLLWTLLPRALAQITTSGLEHVPAEGPALLLCNHISHFDPPLVSLPFPRVIHFMADAPLLKIPVLGPLFRLGHAFPIDRSKNDRAALRTAMERLRAGEVVGIFPEKGIRHGIHSVLQGAQLPVGTASLWKLMKVPVIPMVILGADQLYGPKYLLRRPRIFMRIGPLLPWDPNASKEELRDRIVASWRTMLLKIEADFSLQPDEWPQSAQQGWGGVVPASE